MAEDTDERGYPVPDFQEYRWDIYLRNSFSMIDDDVSTLMNDVGSGVSQDEFDTHVTDFSNHTSASNPHGVTASDVGALADSNGSVAQSNIGFDVALQSDLHTKYTDSEAQSAVDGTDRTFNTVTISDMLSIAPKSSVPSSPTTNDVYLDDGTNTSSGSAGFRYYNGTSWTDL